MRKPSELTPHRLSAQFRYRATTNEQAKKRNFGQDVLNRSYVVNCSVGGLLFPFLEFLLRPMSAEQVTGELEKDPLEEKMKTEG